MYVCIHFYMLYICQWGSQDFKIVRGKEGTFFNMHINIATVYYSVYNSILYKQ